jgi:hypothetical protein
MRKTKTKQDPVSVLDYNQNVIGVDLKGQLLHTYLPERKKNDKMIH